MKLVGLTRLLIDARMRSSLKDGSESWINSDHGGHFMENVAKTLEDALRRLHFSVSLEYP